jgi:DNA-binding IclR family transcriptional regulator
MLSAKHRAAEEAHPRCFVKATVRASRVLQRFQEEEALTVSERHARLGMAKPTFWRTVLTFQHIGILDHRGDGSAVLWPMFISPARLVPWRRGMATGARPHIDALFTPRGHCVNLATFNRADALYIDSSDIGGNVRTVAVIGAGEPLHATAVGKAMLAELDDDEVKAFLGSAPLRAISSETITPRAQLSGELDKVRGDEYGVDDGECAIGAP